MYRIVQTLSAFQFILTLGGVPFVIQHKHSFTQWRSVQSIQFELNLELICSESRDFNYVTEINLWPQITNQYWE
jgi:hypothetical protein